MTPPLDTLLEGLDATHRRVGVLLAELPADAWARTVPATPAWTVADVVSHLASGDQGEWLLAGALGERPAPDATPDLTIEAEPLAFVLRATGRTGGQPWRAEGDQGLAADVAATLSSVS